MVNQPGPQRQTAPECLEADREQRRGHIVITTHGHRERGAEVVVLVVDIDPGQAEVLEPGQVFKGSWEFNQGEKKE